MLREQVVAKICDSGLVAVVRAAGADQALRIAQACYEGGVAALEITFTVPGALDVIKELAGVYKNGEIILGAGTVLDAETARLAILSGAQYVVSPAFNADMVKLCHRYRVAVMPGAMSVKEAIEVLESGADIIKIFPGDLFGPKIIKSISGPLPQARMMPTGGVSIDNVGDWIRAGAVAVGVGGELTRGAKSDDYDLITRTAKEFVARIKQARGR